MKTQNSKTLEDIHDVSGLIASCFSVPDIYIEKYHWVHTVYLKDEEGVNIGEIIISRRNQAGLIYEISIPDYDRRQLLFTVDIQADTENTIREQLMYKWNSEITWKLKLIEIKQRNLSSTYINWKME